MSAVVLMKGEQDLKIQRVSDQVQLSKALLKTVSTDR